jgi:hypothetical protein
MHQNCFESNQNHGILPENLGKKNVTQIKVQKPTICWFRFKYHTHSNTNSRGQNNALSIIWVDGISDDETWLFVSRFCTVYWFPKNINCSFPTTTQIFKCLTPLQFWVNESVVVNILGSCLWILSNDLNLFNGGFCCHLPRHLIIISIARLLGFAYKVNFGITCRLCPDFISYGVI